MSLILGLSRGLFYMVDGQIDGLTYIFYRVVRGTEVYQDLSIAVAACIELWLLALNFPFTGILEEPVKLFVGVLEILAVMR